TDKSIISKLLERLKPKLYQISINPYGTRGLQRILDFISTDFDYEIIRDFLAGNIYNLIKDTNGNHVIQKIIQIFPSEKNTFIIKEMTQYIIDICKLKQGGCVFLKALEKSNDNNRRDMVKGILDNIELIVNDEHG